MNNFIAAHFWKLYVGFLGTLIGLGIYLAVIAP